MILFSDTLNIRGSDIPYNPVFFSYLVIRADLVRTTFFNSFYLSIIKIG